MKEKIKHLDPEKLVGMERIFGYVKFNGKFYDSSEKDGKITLVKVSEKEVEKHKKIAEELAEKLKESLDAKKVLMEVFMTRYDRKSLEGFHKTIFKGKIQYKPKTRDGHCVDMKVGNHIIPIIND